MKPGKLILVSNRLPFSVQRQDSGFQLVRSSGGLVTALNPILERRSGYWIGWPGGGDEEAIQAMRELSPGSYRLLPVSLTEEERNAFYCGFCNEIIWPLFHDLQSRCVFDPTYWTAYKRVNQKFADAVAEVAEHDDFVWVQDYHLMAMAVALRRRSVSSRLGFFHHIPFPPPDIFEKLPWRTDVIRGLLKFQLLGFQTVRDRQNFLACLRRLVPSATMCREGNQMCVRTSEGTTVVGTFPISIDFENFANTAKSADVVTRARQIRNHLNDRLVVLGVDRLDYTKGIPERLLAFRLLLSEFPEMRRNVSLIQVVVPSREDIPKYRELLSSIERLVSQINGEYGEPGWTPVHYIHRSLQFEELLAYYRAADIGLVTPLKDGMNLVAKEYCAAQVDGNGTLIISEFAGAASELAVGATMVNPYDVRGVALALNAACHLTEGERRNRMSKLRDAVRRNDVYKLADNFLAAAFPRGARIQLRTAQTSDLLNLFPARSA